jgi:hypothetical protein
MMPAAARDAAPLTWLEPQQLQLHCAQLCRFFAQLCRFFAQLCLFLAQLQLQADLTTDLLF